MFKLRSRNYVDSYNVLVNNFNGGDLNYAKFWFKHEKKKKLPFEDMRIRVNTLLTFDEKKNLEADPR